MNTESKTQTKAKGEKVLGVIVSKTFAIYRCVSWFSPCYTVTLQDGRTAYWWPAESPSNPPVGTSISAYAYPNTLYGITLRRVNVVREVNHGTI